MNTQVSQQKSVLHTGFTIVESLVAITILMIAMTTVFSAVDTGIRSTTRAQNYVTAAYLAQDAFENVKNQRDTNSTKSPEELWLTDLCSEDTCSLSVFGANGELKRRPDFDDTCGDIDNDCARIYQYNESGEPELYDGDKDSETNWSATRYRRLVTITKLSTNEIEVDVTVKWRGAGGEIRDLTFTRNLLNWRSGS